MLLRSKVPPPFHSFRTAAGVLSEGPAGSVSRKIFGGTLEERKDGIASLALLVQEGKVEAPEAVGIYGRALCDEEKAVRNLSFLNLAQLGSEGIDGLFCGLSSKDSNIRKMSFEMVCALASSDEGILRSANFEFHGTRDKVRQLMAFLGEEANKIKATSCLRLIAARSPLVVLDEVAARKKELRRDSEEYYRLNQIETSALDALRMNSKEAGC
jgi:hypothetical protein